ncbi:MAG: thioredoxin [Clostridiaceae bacterium]|nr:thioredoxin [Clostridiaceae bacterium]
MSSSVITITKENFDTEVIRSEIPVLVDFWAAWCGPCRMVAPVVDEIAKDYEGKVKVGKINVDEQNELAEKFRIVSIPTLMVFKNGQIAESVMGARSKESIAQMLDKHL